MKLFEAFNADEEEKDAYGVRTVANSILTPTMLTKEEAEKVAQAYNEAFSYGLFDVFTEDREASNEVLLKDHAMWVLWKHMFKSVSANSPTKLAVRKSVFDAVVKLRQDYLRLLGEEPSDE